MYVRKRSQQSVWSLFFPFLPNNSLSDYGYPRLSYACNAYTRSQQSVWFLFPFCQINSQSDYSYGGIRTHEIKMVAVFEGKPPRRPPGSLLQEKGQHPYNTYLVSVLGFFYSAPERKTRSYRRRRGELREAQIRPIERFGGGCPRSLIRSAYDFPRVEQRQRYHALCPWCSPAYCFII